MRVTFLLASLLLLLPGCAAMLDQKVVEVHLLNQSVEGSQRLFSTFGFWMLDAPIRHKILAAYRPDGTLDTAALRLALPDATIAEKEGFCAVELNSRGFNSILLRDGPLVAHEAKFDELVRKLSEAALTSTQRTPVWLGAPQ